MYSEGLKRKFERQARTCSYFTSSFVKHSESLVLCTLRYWRAKYKEAKNENIPRPRISVQLKDIFITKLSNVSHTSED